MTIKHIVLSGGGQLVFNYFGIITELIKSEYVNKENIKSIYACSAGAVIGALLCLNHDWKDIEDYIIRCPWHEKIQLNINTIMNAYTSKGIYDTKLFETILKPLLLGSDLKINVTLKELYEFSKIDLHIFTFELNSFTHVNISHSTHPDLTILDALRMSCSYPTLISPLCINDECYIDGGFTRNYPLNDCINEQTTNAEEKDDILGIYANSNNNIIVNNDSTIIDFLKCIMQKLAKTICTMDDQESIKNEIHINSSISFEILFQTLSNENKRKSMIEEGHDIVKEFLREDNDTNVR